jgi:lipopolysaccharide export system permease protein
MRRILPPTIARHLAREFLRTFVLMVVAFVATAIIAEFFDRFETFLKQGADARTIALLFLCRIPLVITHVVPIAVLAGTLVGLGLLARNNEFVALRSCGVSLVQVTAPLLLMGLVIGGATFAWGETVVPASARRWNEIWNKEVKKRRGVAGVFAGRNVWFHGAAGFYNIDRVAPRRRTLYGLTIYQTHREDFRPGRVIEIASATWANGGWQFDGAHTLRIDADGYHHETGLPSGFSLPESLEDFSVVALEPEETSYQMLRRQIRSLRARGVDASEMLVDLHLKIATPAAARDGAARDPAGGAGNAQRLPAAVGPARDRARLLLRRRVRARSARRDHLPPVAAAWAARTLFALVAGYQHLASD